MTSQGGQRQDDPQQQLLAKSDPWGGDQGGVETFSDFPPKCEVVSAALVLDPVLLLSEVLVIQLSLDILAVLVHPGHLLHSEMFTASAEELKLGF